jgi:ERCC4-type nuclease|tara:strand:+ start:1299 stop:1778 length:480 start_codon:yes stop_codon:yes gene_type:complete
MAKAPNYTVIKDTREQEGYHFSKYDKCDGMIVQKIDTGDYTIVGLEEKICIERKASPEELATNLGQKKHAFMNEIERMKPFRHKFIVLEFSLSDLVDFPDNSRIPQSQRKQVKISGKYMLKCLMEFQLKRDIHIIFCGDKHNAFLTISSIFKRVNEMYN